MNKEIEQVRVKKTEKDGTFCFMLIDKSTWKAIVDRTLLMDSQFELAPAEEIKAEAKELIKETVELKQPEPIESSEQTGDSTIDYLRELAKEKKIKGYALMGEKKLKEALNIK